MGAFPIFENHAETWGHSSNQGGLIGLFGEALGHPLRLEVYGEGRFLPAGSAVTTVRGKSVNGPWPSTPLTTTGIDPITWSSWWASDGTRPGQEVFFQPISVVID